MVPRVLILNLKGFKSQTSHKVMLQPADGEKGPDFVVFLQIFNTSNRDALMLEPNKEGVT